MYWKYSFGFLIASLVQAAFIMGFETMGISTLDAELTFGQLIMHILAGQAAGLLLMVIMQGISSIAVASFWLIGSIYGAIIWAILIPINVAQGTINAPWVQGIPTVISSLFAFLVYGIIAIYTVKTVNANITKVT